MLLLAMAGASSDAAALSLTVDGNGLSAIETDGLGFTTPQKAVSNTGDSQTLAMQDIRGATNGFSHTEISLVGSATAAYGTLSGSMSLHAGSIPAGYQAQTRGSFVLSFDDNATVRSDTLPIGTPVTLTFTGEMASSVSLVGLPNYNHAGVNYEGVIRDITTGTTENFALNNAAVGTFPTVEIRTLNAFIGDELEFIGRLSLGGDLQLVFDETSASAAVDAAHTAHFYFNPSPGVDVTLDTASGHSYAAAEPSALALVLCAFAALRRRVLSV